MKRNLLFVFTLFSFCSFAQDFQWANQFGVTCSSIKTDSQKNIYIAGIFGNTFDFDPSSGVYDLTAQSTNYAFVCKFDSLHNLIWAKGFIDVSYADKGPTIALDNLGNIYLAGEFGGTSDFDPGSGIFNMTAIGNTDMFVCKLDNTGNFIWAKQWGSTVGYDRCLSITVDINENVCVTGLFFDTVDFDPGPGTYFLTTNGNYDLFVLKLDAVGNYLWSKQIGSSQSEVGTSIATDGNNNVYVTGYSDYFGNIDFDPSPGVFNLTNSAATFCFIVKLDLSGNLVWAKQFVTSYGTNSCGTAIVIDTIGNIYTTGTFDWRVDFDPAPGASAVYMLSAIGASGYDNAFVCKLDSTGNFVWAKNYRGIATAIDVNEFGEVYSTGVFDYTSDFDPGPGIYNLTAVGNTDIFITKLSEQGNFIWARQIGNLHHYDVYSSEHEESIDVEANGVELNVIGSFNGTLDFDPDTGVFNLDEANGKGFWLKLQEDSCSHVSFSFDSITNLSCPNNGYISAQAISGHPPYNFEWQTSPTVAGSFIQPDTAGIYQVIMTDGFGCAKSASVLINGPSQVTYDLSSYILACSFRPGFPTLIDVIGQNEACPPINGSLKVILDGLSVYDSAAPVPNVINGDTLTWNFSNITFDLPYFSPKVYTHTSTAAQIGTSLCFTSIISPISGDADTTNNIKTFCYPVVNGYDPNTIHVFPTGNCIPHYISNNQLLTYVVQFQNTGNSSAINIHIMDSLDMDLDLNTARVICSSHEVTTEILPNNVLKFNFDSVNLPDSTSNEPGSHGFIIFEVRPDSGLVSGTRIDNQVGVYFDFNPVVLTNSVYNTITDMEHGTSFSTLSINGCDSYTLNGQTYDSSGVYQQIVPNVFGCDSTIQLNLTIRSASGLSINDAGCGSYLFNNQVYTTSGLYTQTFVNSVGCDSIIELNLLITQIDTTVSQSGMNLTANMTGANYQWVNCSTNIPVAGAVSQTYHISVISGDYYVIIEKDGCSDTSTCFGTSTIGLSEMALPYLVTVIPNPTSGEIYIEVGRVVKNIKVQLMDITGRVIMQQQANTDHFSMEIPGAQGLYFVSITDDKGLKTVVKVIKQ